MNGRKSHTDYFYPGSKASRWRGHFYKMYAASAAIVFVALMILELRG